MTQPPAAPPPPAPKAPADAIKSARATIPTAIPLNITSGIVEGCDRIVIYGTGGIGKSTLAAFLPGPVFLDVERSTRKLTVARDAVATWAELRGKLAGIKQAPPEGMRTVVIDTATVAQTLAAEHVVQFKTTDKGHKVDSIERFGWGQGWKFVYEEFLAMVADLDRIADDGFNVCLTAHDVATPAPNPAGEDFLRWEPDLYPGDKREHASIRKLVKNWAEHVVFIAYDVVVHEGKGTGSGTRSIYTQELPTHVAKSRTKQGQFVFDLQKPGAVWQELGIK